MRNKNYKDTLQGLALISQIGFSVITPILIGVYLGQFIDKKLGMNGIFSIIFIILGVGAGFLNIFKLARIKGNKRK
ncbi:AtpZ/AtpI family protein [Tissierella sp.]|uniref:AtpZ/AtpI family protein n=1 Tax=Tissierella sp. TaxID=41274 RepID=UPI0028AD66A2|nr:AtpZ/AtpI family protein [Tissierella sp.]